MEPGKKEWINLFKKVELYATKKLQQAALEIKKQTKSVIKKIPDFLKEKKELLKKISDFLEEKKDLLKKTGELETISGRVNNRLNNQQRQVLIKKKLVIFIFIILHFIFIIESVFPSKKLQQAALEIKKQTKSVIKKISNFLEEKKELLKKIGELETIADMVKNRLDSQQRQDLIKKKLVISIFIILHFIFIIESVFHSKINFVFSFFVSGWMIINLLSCKKEILESFINKANSKFLESDDLDDLDSTKDSETIVNLMDQVNLEEDNNDNNITCLFEDSIDLNLEENNNDNNITCFLEDSIDLNLEENNKNFIIKQYDYNQQQKSNQKNYPTDDSSCFKSPVDV